MVISIMVLNKILRWQFLAPERIPKLFLHKRGLAALSLLLPQWYCCIGAQIASRSNCSNPLQNVQERNMSTTQQEPQKCVAPVICNAKDLECKLGEFLDPKKTLALLLDYDGTLAPIAPNANDTYMREPMMCMLNRLAKHPKIYMALISGRAVKDLKCRVKIEGITYSGNHGMEIEMHDGQRLDRELTKEMQEKYEKMVSEMRKTLEEHGSWIEDKKISLAYHYRHAPEDKQQAQIDTAVRIIEEHGFRVARAHGAIDAKAPMDWHKGKAAKCILHTKFGDQWQGDTVSILFAGDDNTDEDAMKELKGIAKTFRISPDPKLETYGDYRFPSMDLMDDLFNFICKVYNIP